MTMRESIEKIIQAILDALFPKPTPPTTTTTTTTTTPRPTTTTTTTPRPSPPPPASGLTPVLPLPSGMVQSRRPDGKPWGVPWSNVARWANVFESAGREFGVAPLLLAMFSLVESDSEHYRDGRVVVSGPVDRPSVGIMQVVCYYHAATLPGADCWSPEGNIRIAAKLLASWMRELGTWERALTERYHPGTDPTSGVSPETYIRAVRDLIHEVKSARGHVSPPPSPPPPGTSFGTTYPVSGTGRTVMLPFPLRQAIVPPEQTNQRPGIRMTPDRYVQHDTGNRTPGAGSLMHARYLLNGAEGQVLSYHFTVDDREAYQMIPVNEVAWHGGDGSGPCNMRGLSCELCINADSNEAVSRRNAEILAAELMNALGINSLKKHEDCTGKRCPQDMLNDGYWPQFVQNVSRYREERQR